MGMRTLTIGALSPMALQIVHLPIPILQRAAAFSLGLHAAAPRDSLSVHFAFQLPTPNATAHFQCFLFPRHLSCLV